ncbi:glycoside hydrolase family 25 protein [Cruoricaptor ignavus]|nr:GH25 family lysozyme [Cruoricaptor ignavus]
MLIFLKDKTIFLQPMSQAKKKARKKKKPAKPQAKGNRLKIILFGAFLLVFFFAGLFITFKDKIAFHWASCFNKFEHKTLTNTEFERNRIHTIISENTDKVFGIDISHYQRKEDIKWDSLSIGSGSIPIRFIILRSTMGNHSADRHFPEYWQKAKQHNLIRGAYHFYRPDEDPVLQANNFLAKVNLETGDLPPVLDIEKPPLRKTKTQLIQDLKIWCRIMEDAYGRKPIIYTYYHFYKDNLRGEFDDYPLWLANYNPVKTPSPSDEWRFWQFSENGIVHGINTKVDLNVFNGGMFALRRMGID